MMAPHRIDELVFDLAFASKAQARQQQADLSDWVSTQLLPLIDELFDEYGVGRHLYFDTLELDLGAVPSQTYQSEIASRLETELRKILAQAPASATPETTRLAAEAQSSPALKRLLQYLQRGIWPEHTEPTNPNQIWDEVLQRHLAEFLHYLRTTPDRPAVLARLLATYSRTQVTTLLRAIPTAPLEWVADSLALFDLAPLSSRLLSTPERIDAVLWSSLFEAILRNPIAADRPSFLAQIIQGMALQLAVVPQAILRVLQQVSSSWREQPGRWASLAQEVETLVAEPANRPSASVNPNLESKTVVDPLWIAKATMAELVNACNDLQQGSSALPEQSLHESQWQRLLLSVLARNAQTHQEDHPLLVTNILNRARSLGDPQRFYRAAFYALLQQQALDLDTLSRQYDVSVTSTIASDAESVAAQNNQIETDKTSDLVASTPEQKTVTSGKDGDTTQTLNEEWLNRSTGTDLLAVINQMQQGELALPAQALSENIWQRLLLSLLARNAQTHHADHHDLVAQILANATRHANPQLFLRSAFAALLQQQPLDLEALMDADLNATTLPPSENEAPIQATSTVLGLSLQQRLAEALLKADFEQMQADWPLLLSEQREVLRQALRHYATRPEVRQQLMVRFPWEPLLSLLELLSGDAAELLRLLSPIAQKWASSTQVALAEDDPNIWLRQAWELYFQQALLAPAAEITRQNLWQLLLRRQAGADNHALQQLEREWLQINPALPKWLNIDTDTGLWPSDLTTASKSQLSRILQTLSTTPWPQRNWQKAELEHLLAFAVAEQGLIDTEFQADWLAAIENNSAASINPVQYYRDVLETLLAKQELDLESISARQRPLKLPPDSNTGTNTADSALDEELTTEELAADDIEQDPSSRRSTSPLLQTLNLAELSPLALRQALAQALLNADATAFAAWLPLTNPQPREVLSQALRHYGQQAHVRQNLMARLPVAQLLNLLEVLHAPAQKLLTALYPHALLLQKLEPGLPLVNDELWQRQLWEQSLQWLLEPANASGSVEALSQHLILQRSGSDRSARASLQRVWAEILKPILSAPPISAEGANPIAVESSGTEINPASKNPTTAPVLSGPALLQQQLQQVLQLQPAAALDDPKPLSLATLLSELSSNAPALLLEVYQQLQTRQALHYLNLPLPEWQMLVNTWVGIDPALNPAARQDILAAIDTQRSVVSDGRGYERRVLLALLQQQGLDLDAIVVQSSGPAVAPTSNNSRGGEAEIPALPQTVTKTSPDTEIREQDVAETPLTPESAALQQQLEAQWLQLLSAPMSGLQQQRFVALTENLFTRSSTPLSSAALSALRENNGLETMVKYLPERWLQRVLTLMWGSVAEAMLRCANVVIDAVALLLPRPEPERLVHEKWHFLFRYLWVQEHAFVAEDFIRAMTDHLVQLFELPEQQRARLLVQRRFELLAPEALQTQTPAVNPYLKPEKPATKAVESALEEGLWVNYAGVVLAAPYLPRLFALLKLTVDGQFVDFYASQRAAYLLQYLVQGSTDASADGLLLNKLICGIGTAIPLLPDLELSANDKAVAEQLLQGIIQNWSIIGKTSIEGLRTTFLQRPGWIALKDDAWQLKVQTGTFDMLLDKLPWSFSIIKYAWMEKPIHVTWR